jgi:hypothetical protein
VSVVIELTMHAKLGHFAEVIDLYTQFCQEFQDIEPDVQTIHLTADPGSGLIRGIVIYNHANVAETVNSRPIFANFMDSIEPMLTSAPERIELQLLHSWLTAS